MKKITVTAILFLNLVNYLPAQTQTAAAAHALLSAASKPFRALPKEFSIPVPPTIEFKCNDLTASQSKSITDYVETFQQPEKLIIERMLSASKIFAKLNNAEGSRAALHSASIAFGRLAKKAIKGLNAYGGDRWKSIAICKAALTIDHDNSLLSGNSTTTILELIATKLGEVEIQLFKDLKHQHDFTLIDPIFYYDKQVSLLIGQSNLERLTEKLRDALSFTIKIDQQLQNYVDGKLVRTYKANGEAKLSWAFNGVDIVGDL